MYNLVKIAKGNQAHCERTTTHDQHDTVSSRDEGAWDYTVLLPSLNATFEITVVAVFESEAEEIIDEG